MNTYPKEQGTSFEMRMRQWQKSNKIGFYIFMKTFHINLRLCLIYICFVDNIDD